MKKIVGKVEYIIPKDIPKTNAETEPVVQTSLSN